MVTEPFYIVIAADIKDDKLELLTKAFAKRSVTPFSMVSRF